MMAISKLMSQGGGANNAATTSHPPSVMSIVRPILLPMALYSFLAFLLLSGFGGYMPYSLIGRHQFKEGAPSVATVLQGLSATELESVRFKRLLTQKPAVMAVCDGCGCGTVCDLISERRIFAPVESTIFEHIWSITPQSSRVLVDVGANVGYFSVLSAAWGARVTAFEPNSEARRMLEISAALQPEDTSIQVHPYAVGFKEDTANVKVNEKGWAFSRVQLAAATDNSSNVVVPADDNAVKIVRLSDYVKGHVTILKVDTEGFESAVFEGAYDVLKWCNYVIAEVKDFNSRAKRDLLYNILEAGKFTYVYNYKEMYSDRPKHYPVLDAEFQDVTALIAGKSLSMQLQFEDFVFARQPIGLIRPADISQQH